MDGRETLFDFADLSIRPFMCPSLHKNDRYGCLSLRARDGSVVEGFSVWPKCLRRTTMCHCASDRQTILDRLSAPPA